MNAGVGNDVLWLGRGSWGDLDELNSMLKVKDLITGGTGKDRFIFNSWSDQFAYDLNGNNVFYVIKDYEIKDKIVVFGDADYRIDGRNGRVNLRETGAYNAQSISYTARLYADDDLIAYISGFQPTLADLKFHP